MPIISIFGATGTQGSAVLNAVLKDGTFTPRAITRSPDSDAAKSLNARGVEVVKGDLSSKDSIREAIKGSEVVFGVTSFFDPQIFPGTSNGKGEIDQGKNLVDAAKEAGIKFFVWSSLPSATAVSNGKYTIPNFDNKAIIFEYLKASGVPYAAVLPGYFFENLWIHGSLKKEAAGYILPIPRYSPGSLQTFTWIGKDLGPAVLALSKNYTNPDAKILGKTFPVTTARLTFPELASHISAAIGKEVVFKQVETGGLEEINVIHAYQSDFCPYIETAVPNPDLVALGVKFGDLEELIKAEIVPRFSRSSICLPLKRPSEG